MRTVIFNVIWQLSDMYIHFIWFNDLATSLRRLEWCGHIQILTCKYVFWDNNWINYCVLLNALTYTCLESVGLKEAIVWKLLCPHCFPVKAENNSLFPQFPAALAAFYSTRGGQKESSAGPSQIWGVHWTSIGRFSDQINWNGAYLPAYIGQQRPHIPYVR